MTGTASAVGELAVAGMLSGKVLPVVGIPAQRQLHHSIGCVVAHLAVGLDGAIRRLVVIAASSDDEFPDALRIRLLLGILGGESFVDVIVAVKHQLNAKGVEVVPEGLQRRMVEVSPGGKTGLMPEGERAEITICCQITQEPLLLRASGTTAANTGLVAFAVESDDMPVAEIEAVIAPGRVAGTRTEIGE